MKAIIRSEGKNIGYYQFQIRMIRILNTQFPIIVNSTIPSSLIID